MKHTTMLSVYRAILQDSTIEHHDFVKIVAYMQRYNGRCELEKEVKQLKNAVQTQKKRGRPPGSKNKLDDVFSRPNDGE